MEKRLGFPPVSFFVGIQNLILLSTTGKSICLSIFFEEVALSARETLKNCL